ncbi:VOC family protein [Brevundimonas sp. NPDC058933]|uniref:VOC family protein n=1 Tax=Brevundimonas sp. NPDC058933 TaxID=3346673 RepID=UPI003BEF0B63
MIQLGYFTLDTPDVEKARAFYAGLFGWTFDEGSSHPTYAHVAASNPAFGITKGEHRAFPHLYFRVDDIHDACARVTALGGQAAIPAESPSGLSAVVADDQGVSFSLWQPAPGY